MWINRISAAGVLLLGALLAGCNGDTTSTENLPQGSELTSKAATAMKSVDAVSLDIATEGKPKGLPLTSAAFQLTNKGEATGKAVISIMGPAAEYNFTLVGDSLYLKGVTGGYTKLPSSMVTSFFDPSAILNPDKGVAHLLATAKNPQTEASETINGRKAYRVKVEPDATAVKSLVPVSGEVKTAQVWIDAENSQVLQVKLPVPADSGEASATVKLSDFGKPVTIQPPQ
ncbi:LppX_LprAFG lipoprotein [Pseudonocardiaceae bacterium YIM PH 21723]|nr:LppX_LprAFG lipoprotein [Pseudonocardiaceae bacterium YIM PH 21723]